MVLFHGSGVLSCSPPSFCVSLAFLVEIHTDLRNLGCVFLQIGKNTTNNRNRIFRPPTKPDNPAWNAQPRFVLTKLFSFSFLVLFRPQLQASLRKLLNNDDEDTARLKHPFDSIHRKCVTNHRRYNPRFRLALPFFLWCTYPIESSSIWLRSFAHVSRQVCVRELSNNQELVWLSIAREKRESKSPFKKKGDHQVSTIYKSHQSL